VHGGTDYINTVRSKSFRTDFFKNRRHIQEETYFFFFFYKLHWHIYRLVRSHTLCEKLPKIPLIGPSVHQLRLLGSQQHPQSGVPLTSFSTWRTENSPTEINLESMGGDKRVVTFFWVKNWQTLAALWAGALLCNKKQPREQNAAGWTH
jgi:hypothetical protein